MCGIAGFIEGRPSGEFCNLSPSARLERMLQALKHRGPDDWGMSFSGFPPEEGFDPAHVTWNPSGGAKIALGHRRLSILDLSASGRQPMTRFDGELAITFNGEIYNYIELREELSRCGNFQTGTDTEVLLEAYRQWGVEMLGKLDGMFAFALWDARRRQLFCARDPLGIKPFYYACGNGEFIFASEPRSVLAGLNTRGHADRARLAEFLILGQSDHDEGTSYQEVKQLRGGQWMELDPHGSICRTGVFWSPSGEGVYAEEKDIPGLVKQQIDLAIYRQLRSDVEVGGCLSGGLDSGSIVSTVGRVLADRSAGFKAFTLANSDFAGDETALAGLAASRAGVQWVRVENPLGEIRYDLEKMIEVMGEPFTTLSMFGQYRVMKLAGAHGMKVMLDGQGGDEVFLGYNRVAQLLVGEYSRKGQISLAAREWWGLSRNASTSLTASFLGNVFFRSPHLAVYRNRRRMERFVSSALLEPVRMDVAQDYYSDQSVEQMQIKELTRYVLPRLLRYEDRNSMAFGLEARVPMLAVGLVELAMRLPLHWRMRNGWTKYALRQAMKDRLPHEILWNRRKRGFEVPQRRWIEGVRTEIASWLADLPADSPFNRAEMLKEIDAGRSGSHWFWRCLSVGLWIRFSGVRL